MTKQLKDYIKNPKRSIRLNKLKSLYDYIEVIIPEGTKEGSPEEVEVKAGDVVLLPVTDVSSPDVDMWTDLAPFRVLAQIG